MRQVFEQPVRQPHPDFDAGLAGRKIEHKNPHSLQAYLDSIRHEQEAIIEHCPHDESPFLPQPDSPGARHNIFGAHPQSQLYRYRLPQDEEWSYVLLWETAQ